LKKNLSMKKISLIALFFILIFSVSSCFIIKEIQVWFPSINDYKYFPSHQLYASETPYYFFRTKKEIEPAPIPSFGFDKNISFTDLLKKTNTTAFLIIRNDTILYEHYFYGYADSIWGSSFSMAKSFTSGLIGFAVQDGLINIDVPITQYIPELKHPSMKQVTIKHLLQMTSGIRYKENYKNPFSSVALDYYGKNLKHAFRRLKTEVAPGTRFKYQSVNTQLLGFALKSVLHNKTLTQYLQEKVWTPIGSEYPGSWNIDGKKNEMEKTFCCLNATARDYAKYGRLYLNKGMWNGKRLLNEEWITNSTKIDSSQGSKPYYQYQWWIPPGTHDFSAMGFLGQFIYISPEKKLIIVRLGKDEGKISFWKFLVALSKQF